MSGPPRVHDFRSDTVTRPDAEMRQRMADAEVGDDVLGDDPTVLRLQEKAAEYFGSEAALFVPSGTMANQIAVKVLTRPGDEILVEQSSHVFLYEVGGLAQISGVQARCWSDPDAIPDPRVLEGLLRPDDVHQPATTLLAIENSHNALGGRVVPVDAMRRASQWARERGLAVFLDGARLGNAAVAAGVEASEFVACADLVSTCLSKGLGCPVGSLLLGDAGTLQRARRIRKLLGGGMRQSGILAAAGLLALERGMTHLAEDHRRAKQLAEGIQGVSGCSVAAGRVETNLVMVHRPRGDAARFVSALGEHGVLAAAFTPQCIRFVTHLDVDDEGVDAAIAAVHEVAATAAD